jgi:hypothetical protein
VQPVAHDYLKQQAELVTALKADHDPTCAAHPELSALLAKGLAAIAEELPNHTLILTAYPSSDAQREPPLQQLARSLLAADSELAARVSVQPLLTRTRTVQQRSSVPLAERAVLEFDEVNTLSAAPAVTQVVAGPCVIVLLDDVITTGTSLAAGELQPTCSCTSQVSLAVVEESAQATERCADDAVQLCSDIMYSCVDVLASVSSSGHKHAMTPLVVLMMTALSCHATCTCNACTQQAPELSMVYILVLTSGLYP